MENSFCQYFPNLYFSNLTRLTVFYRRKKENLTERFRQKFCPKFREIYLKVFSPNLLGINPFITRGTVKTDF